MWRPGHGCVCVCVCACVRVCVCACVSCAAPSELLARWGESLATLTQIKNKPPRAPNRGVLSLKRLGGVTALLRHVLKSPFHCGLGLGVPGAGGSVATRTQVPDVPHRVVAPARGLKQDTSTLTFASSEWPTAQAGPNAFASPHARCISPCSNVGPRHVCGKAKRTNPKAAKAATPNSAGVALLCRGSSAGLECHGVDDLDGPGHLPVMLTGGRVPRGLPHVPDEEHPGAAAGGRRGPHHRRLRPQLAARRVARATRRPHGVNEAGCAGAGRVHVRGRGVEDGGVNVPRVEPADGHVGRGGTHRCGRVRRRRGSHLRPLHPSPRPRRVGAAPPERGARGLPALPRHAVLAFHGGPRHVDGRGLAQHPCEGNRPARVGGQGRQGVGGWWCHALVDASCFACAASLAAPGNPKHHGCARARVCVCVCVCVWWW